MIVLNSSDTNPLYKQLYTQIKARILSGALPADRKLPSVRDLAAELSISRNTVEGAYLDLYAEGYIYSKPRSGYFVSALDPDSAALSLPRNLRESDRLREIASLPEYDFHPARLDRESFPAATWRKCFTDALRQSSRDLTHYCDGQGEWELRCNIQKYLGRSRGVICEPEQIVICAGLQQSLDVVAQLLRGNHSRVAVENPGYHLPRSVFRNHRYDILPVRVGKNGLDFDILQKSGASIAYVTPSHQFPLGYVMPVANRLRLIEWAEAGEKFIIEDDYDSELRYHGKPIPSLQGLRPGGNIFYLGTFSKILSPALRVSYLVLPESMLSDYRRVFVDYFSVVSLLEQRTLAKFMELGHWERHVRRMRTVYKNKHDTMLRCIGEHFGSRAQVIGQGAGLHVALQIGGKTLGEERDLIARAWQYGIKLFPYTRTRVTDEPEPMKLLLGFGGMTAGELERGVALLSRLCG